MSANPTQLDLTVLMPTYNRADDLSETLDYFATLERGDLKLEIVVIDNNSTDSTREVVESFQSRLPVRYLFQPKPGKNAALNLALEEFELGELVVFTDDDVRPALDWFLKIGEVSEAFPDYDVFGGRTYVIWPQDPPPAWAKSDDIIGWGFASNSDIGLDYEGPYPERRYPVGFNYWVRKRALQTGRRFDENLGPVPKNRILGDETRFQIELAEDGCQILYTPRAVVGHKIQASLVTPEGIFRRAWSIGRTGPNLNGLRQASLHEQHPLAWRVLRYVSVGRYALHYALARVWPSANGRVERRVAAIRGLAANLEQLKIARRPRESMVRAEVSA